MVQILLATYNGEKYLREQLDSLLNQTYTDFEIIAGDDCSADGTFAILEEYKNKYPEKFTIYKNAEPTGNARDNFFLLMKKATAEYVMFCDQDDSWLPDKIEITLEKMKKEEKNLPCLVHTDLFVADKDLNITNKSFFRMQHFDRCVDKTPLNRALAQNCVTGCTVMINKALLNLAKNTACDGIIMHDWWLAIIASAFGTVAAIKKPTILYRQHGGNSVGAKTFLQNSFGKTNKNIPNALNITYIQAGAFVNTFENALGNKKANTIKTFSNLRSLPRIRRRLFVLKNRFFKHSFIRKIAQLIFG